MHVLKETLNLINLIIINILYPFSSNKPFGPSRILNIENLERETNIKQIDNNFPWSVFLSTIEMTSKCSKLKSNHEPQASGFTAKY